MTQKKSDSNSGAGSITGPAPFCEPELVWWYLELERGIVLKRRTENAVYSTKAEIRTGRSY